MTAKENKRRYYLHSKIKKVVKLYTKAKTLGVIPELVDALTIRESKYIGELQSKFNYSVQYEIQ